MTLTRVTWFPCLGFYIVRTETELDFLMAPDVDPLRTLFNRTAARLYTGPCLSLDKEGKWWAGYKYRNLGSWFFIIACRAIGRPEQHPAALVIQ